MPEKDQVKAIELLRDALRALTAPDATPEERARVAVQINTFLITSPSEPAS